MDLAFFTTYFLVAPSPFRYHASRAEETAGGLYGLFLFRSEDRESDWFKGNRVWNAPNLVLTTSRVGRRLVCPVFVHCTSFMILSKVANYTYGWAMSKRSGLDIWVFFVWFTYLGGSECLGFLLVSAVILMSKPDLWGSPFFLFPRGVWDVWEFCWLSFCASFWPQVELKRWTLLYPPPTSSLPPLHFVDMP